MSGALVADRGRLGRLGLGFLLWAGLGMLGVDFLLTIFTIFIATQNFLLTRLTLCLAKLAAKFHWKVVKYA